MFIGKTEEDPPDAGGEENSSDEEETLSLLDISNSDNEEVRTAAVHKKARQSDILYAAW